MSEVIFVVDDDEINLTIATYHLNAENYTTYTAMSGSALFALLEEATPDLILLDIMMPEMDGFAVIRVLKSEESTKDIPVIFLTSSDDAGSEIRGLREGAVDYIRKPFSAEVLKIRVHTHLILQRQKREMLATVKNAEIASEAKSSFIAIMSHEMRTPLNAILGFAELSLDAEYVCEQVYTNLLNIQNAGKTLLSLINDMLDISKIEMGKFELVPIEYGTAGMLNDVLTQSILHKGEKPIEFILKISDNFPATLFGDELRVRQVLSNVISNAFKYTANGKVELSLAGTAKGGSVWVYATIRDTGMGIKPEDIERVFEDYVQTDRAANRRIVGTGLGLSISRRLACMMGGDIKLASEYGKGSTFTVRIKQGFVSSDSIGAEAIKDLKEFNYTEKRHRRTQFVALQSLTSAHVLVVDDVETNLEVAVGMLRRYSITAECVTSGADAIAAMQNADARYDAIFMDHMMPNMDGIEALQHIRAIGTPLARNIPVIAFTANAIVGNEQMFLENGFQAFLTKPLEASQLDSVIREWVWDRRKNIFAEFDVNGVDFDKGLLRFGGDTGSYLNVLRSFSRTVPTNLDRIVTVSSKNLSEYMVLVHGIRGACFGICADEAAALATALEDAAKVALEKNVDIEEHESYKYICENNQAFIVYVRELLAGVGNVLATIDSGVQKNRKDGVCAETLAKLSQACANHSINEIDELVEELDAFVYENERDSDLVAHLKGMADDMDYAGMAECLLGIVK